MSPALGCGISIARLMAPLHVANDPLAATAARSASTERTAACNTAAAWVGTRRAATSAAVAGGADGSCSGVGGGHLPPRNGGSGILSAKGCVAAKTARTGSITCHRGNAARLPAPLLVPGDPLAAPPSWLTRASGDRGLPPISDAVVSGVRVPAVCQHLARVVVAHGESGEAVEHGDAAGGTRRPHTAP